MFIDGRNIELWWSLGKGFVVWLGSWSSVEGQEERRSGVVGGMREGGKSCHGRWSGRRVVRGGERRGRYLSGGASAVSGGGG